MTPLSAIEKLLAAIILGIAAWLIVYGVWICR
jgi:hypothetical protein